MHLFSFSNSKSLPKIQPKWWHILKQDSGIFILDWHPPDFYWFYCGVVLHQLRGSAMGKQGTAEYPPSFVRNQDIFSYKFGRDLSKSRRDLSGFCRQTLREQRGSSALAAGLGGAEPSVPGDSRGHRAGPGPRASFPHLRANTSPPRTQPGPSHPFPKGQQPALEFIVKPQKRSLFLSAPLLRAHRTALPPRQIFQLFPKLFH